MPFFTAASTALWSCIEGPLVEKITDAAGKTRLKHQVQDFTERWYRDRFETISLTEEFDFEGINIFLQEHLKQEVSACFNAPGREQREAAKQMLFTSACTHAKANTQAKKGTVRQYLEAFLDIVEHFFLERVDEKTWFLCGRTVDETAQAVEAFLQQHADQITEIIRYHNSFAEYIDNLQPQGNSRNLFHYRNTDLGFYGRESEMEALDSFLEQEGQILWMAVVGDGGVGKSKLLYHFCAQVSNRPDWKTVWFSKNICERVNEYQNWAYPDRLLIVADYAGEMAKQLGDWLGKLAEINPSCRPKQLRLILLEQENLGEVAPVWYQAFTGGREQRQAVEQFCVNLSSPCIELHGLGNEALKAMVMDYAHSKNRELLETNLTFVLEKAHEIDLNNLAPRPLVTLFIADAVLEGKAYTHWNITALVENIISRYRNHWKVSVCDNNEERYESLHQMLVYATATGGWDLQVLPAPLETASRTLLASRQVLEPLVCAVNEEPTFRERLSPLEPDLVGEFFVLDYLNDKYYDKTTLAAIVQLFWGRRENFWSFLNRCIQNYYNEPRFQTLFGNGLAAFEPEAEDASAVIPFSKLLANLTCYQFEREAEQTVAKLETLADRFHGSTEIALEYAKGLINLSADQSAEDASQTIIKFRTLTKQFPESAKMALEYARGLVNLSHGQSAEDAIQTISELKTVTERFANSEEIALRYAKGLFNYSNKQSVAEAAQTVTMIGALARQHPTSDEIALVYANGLSNLFIMQSQSAVDTTQTVANMGELARQHPDSEEIARLYTQMRDCLS